MYITYNHLNPHGFGAIEGIGSQYQKIIILYATIKKYNLKYIHIPIRVGHNYDNDKDWDEKWDNFFNFKKLSNNDEVDIDKINNMEKYFVNKNTTIDIILNNNKPDSLYLYFNTINIFEEDPDYYFKDIQNDLINAYDENNNHRTLIYNKNKTSIAIHIRVYNDSDNEGEYEKYSEVISESFRYYFTAEMYENLINKLKEKYANSEIHIFSQEKYFDIKFKKLRDIKDIQFHFDDIDVFDTFHHLCKADVLVMGLSSLSSTVAFYNKNTVIYLPFIYPQALKSWIFYNDNVSL
jgi:hypothetical protein